MCSRNQPLAWKVTPASRSERYLTLKIHLGAARIVRLAATVFPHGAPQAKETSGPYVGDEDAHLIDAVTPGQALAPSRPIAQSHIAIHEAEQGKAVEWWEKVVRRSTARSAALSPNAALLPTFPTPESVRRFLGACAIHRRSAVQRRTPSSALATGGVITVARVPCDNSAAQMSDQAKQAAVLRCAVADLLDGDINFPDAADLRDRFATAEVRREFARRINSRAVQISRDLPSGEFLGVVNEFELARVSTFGDLIELLLRHTNGQLEDDAWSAF